MPLPNRPNPSIDITSEVIYTRPYVRFIKKIVQLDNLTKDCSYAEIDDGIGIVAINNKQEIVLVGQWRYGVGQYLWELPAGTREGEEDLLEGAKRELREETGVTAKKWDFLGEFLMESSTTTKKCYLFLAQDLEEGSQDLDEDERIEVLWMPFEKALDLVRQGELKNAMTVIGLLRAKDELMKDIAK